jgi:uncharacterized lipoprotein YehR (DUF1307 family)
MKRVSKLLLIVLCLVVFITTGCTKETKNEEKTTTEDKTETEDKTMQCKRTATISDGVTVDLSYTVTYADDYVKKIYSNEQVKSTNSTYLKSYKEQVESIYSPYKGIEYYDYDVRIEGNTLISEATIDYEKVDTDKLIEVDSANSSIIKNGKIKVSDIKTLYNNVGATCD